MNREKSLFLCSKRAPYSLYNKVFDWVDSLSSNDCVICFNSSELEDEVMRALLVNQVPTILVVMNRFTDKYNVQIEKALEEQRMLILVLQRDEPYGAGQTPRLRNQYMMQMAENIVCGYIDKNGSIFPLLAGVQNVRYLEQEEMMMAAEPLAHPLINDGQYGKIRYYCDCSMKIWDFMQSKSNYEEAISLSVTELRLLHYQRRSLKDESLKILS